MQLQNQRRRKVRKIVTRHSSLATHFGVLVVVLPLIVYLLTLQNGLTPGELQGGDPITHQYAQATLRFANAPGYPIFTVLGWLWFQISALLSFLFNPIERLALYSTLYAIASLVLLYRILLVLAEAPISKSRASIPNPAQASQHPTIQPPNHLTIQPPNHPTTIALAALATLFFAFTYFFWYYAITSENYSSGVLNTLLIIALALRWQERRDERTLLWLAFVCGLSLAHLLTVALAVPAVILFVVGQQPNYLRRPRLILKSVLVTFLPLLSYAYVYWRGAEHPEWRGRGSWPDTWTWFVDFLTTKQGQSELVWSWDGIPWSMLQLVANELTLVVLIGGVIGLFLLPRWRAVLLLGMVAVYAPFMYVDRYGNWFQAIIPLYPVFIVGAFVVTIRTHILMRRAVSPNLVGGLFVGLFLLGTGVKLIENYAVVNQRDRPQANGLAPGWALLADEPERNSKIVGTYAEDLALDYLTQIWSVRRDIKTLSPALIPVAFGQPLSVSRMAMPTAQKNIAPTVKLSTHGLNLIELKVQPAFTLPRPVRTVERDLGHGLQLAAYDVKLRAEQIDLILYWRAARPIDLDMAVSIRLLNGSQPVMQEAQPFQIDSAHPVAGFYAMTRWAPGEVVRDEYALPSQVARHADQVRVLVYRATPSGFENLAEVNLPLSAEVTR